MVMNIQVLTLDRVICSTTANKVVLPGLTGQVGLLDAHTSLIIALDTGLLRIKLDNKCTSIILCGGLAEIDRSRVTAVFMNDKAQSVTAMDYFTKQIFFFVLNSRQDWHTLQVIDEPHCQNKFSFL